MLLVYMAYNEGGTVDNIPQLDVTGWVKKLLKMVEVIELRKSM